MGAALFLVGLIAAGVTAPLFDRVLTHHLALTCRVLCPIVGVLWLSLIWAGRSHIVTIYVDGANSSIPTCFSFANNLVKPNNATALYVILGLIGACSIPVLPVALELAVEVTRNADGSSAVLWAVCVLCSSFLRSSSHGLFCRGNIGNIMFVLGKHPFLFSAYPLLLSDFRRHQLKGPCAQAQTQTRRSTCTAGSSSRASWCAA